MNIIASEVGDKLKEIKGNQRSVDQLSPLTPGDSIIIRMINSDLQIR